MIDARPALSGCACSARRDAARHRRDRSLRRDALERSRAATSATGSHRSGARGSSAVATGLAWPCACVRHAPARRPAMSVNSKPDSASAAPSARNTRQPGRASPGGLLAAQHVWSAVEIGQGCVDFRQAAIGRITSATATRRLASEAKRHHLRAAQRLSSAAHRRRNPGRRLACRGSGRPNAARAASLAHRGHSAAGNDTAMRQAERIAPRGMRHSASGCLRNERAAARTRMHADAPRRIRRRDTATTIHSACLARRRELIGLATRRSHAAKRRFRQRGPLSLAALARSSSRRAANAARRCACRQARTRNRNRPD